MTREVRRMFAALMLLFTLGILTNSGAQSLINLATQVKGTLGASHLPNPTTSTIGGVQAKDCSASSQLVQKINTDGTVGCASATSAGGGTVSSVGLSMPGEYSVSGSPVTGSSTITISKATQSANLVYAGPSSGSAAAPTFRALVSADLPSAGSSGTGWVLLESHVASSSAELDFTSRNATGQSGLPFQSDFDEYAMEINNLIPAANAGIYLRFSTNGGTSYDSGSNYSYGGIRWDNGGGTGSDGASANAIDLSGSQDSTAIQSATGDGGLNGSYKLFNPLNTTAFKIMSFQSYYFKSVPIGVIANGRYVPTTAVNSFKIFAVDGSSNPQNLTSGVVRLYGLSN